MLFQNERLALCRWHCFDELSDVEQLGLQSIDRIY